MTKPKEVLTVCLHLRAFGCEQCKAVLKQYDDLLREVFEAAAGDWDGWLADMKKSVTWFDKCEKLFAE